MKIIIFLFSIKFSERTHIKLFYILQKREEKKMKTIT